jgi:hypothetical protein
MPSIVYNGLRYIQTKNSIQCLHCQDILTSQSVHDFHMCSCKTVGIDGGISAGNRVLGNRSDYKDLSIWKTEDGIRMTGEEYQKYLAMQRRS